MFQAHLIISGKVQGVFYRDSCQEIAQGLILTGWVKNMPNGQVEVLVQGEKEKIEKLIEWCKKGPPEARIDNVEVRWNRIVNNFESFFISN